MSSNSSWHFIPFRGFDDDSIERLVIRYILYEFRRFDDLTKAVCSHLHLQAIVSSEVALLRQSSLRELWIQLERSIWEISSDESIDFVFIGFWQIQVLQPQIDVNTFPPYCSINLVVQIFSLLIG